MPALDFTLMTDAGTPLSLTSLRGRAVVLYFYPKDDTPGCTTEARAFTAILPRLTALGAVVLGVDKPWDVCLIKLFVEVMTASVKTNVQQLRQRHLFDPDGGAKARARQEIESMFRAAAKDPSLINALGQKLQQAKLFSEYEDRFFSLLHARKE